MSILEPESSLITAMKALSISNLSKTYSGGVTALRSISLDVELGDFFALLGPNGAGKSTMIGIIASLINKTEGKITVFDKDLDVARDEAKKIIGLVPQEFNFNIFEKVFDIVVNQAGFYGIHRKMAIIRAEYYLKKLSLWHRRDTVSQALSGGMKRKLMIVRALIHQPKLLILDEPTAGVDVETRRDMWSFLIELNKNGTTIILTTHYLEEAERLCRNVAIIDNGEIIENSSVKKLLDRLEYETFIINLKHPITNTLPFGKYSISKIDETTLKVDLLKEEAISDIILHLHKHGMEVLTIRNRSSRLEELFINLTQKK